MKSRLTVGVIGQFLAGSTLAHAINVTKTAGGFARLGYRVLLFCQRPAPGVEIDTIAREYAEPLIEWRFPPTSPSLIAGDPALEFARWAIEECRAARVDLVYARHFHAALIGAESGLRVALETHAHVGDSNPLLERCFQATHGTTHARLDAIITISPVLGRHYVSRGADASRVRVVPDGVDEALFTPPSALPPKPVELVGDQPVAVYAGHLYDYKGIPTILQAAALLPRVRFVLLGGLPEDVSRTQATVAARHLCNVCILGPRPHSTIPSYLWHAGTLLLTPSATHASAAWTSPVKLGEYLASGRPIVASDIGGLREWVHEPVVRWCRPDCAESLSAQITAAIAEDPAAARVRKQIASSLCRRLSYSSRAHAIVAAVERAVHVVTFAEAE